MKISRFLFAASALTGLLMSGSAYAVSSGLYAGVGIGETNTHYTAKVLGLTTADIRNFGFAPSLWVGYQFNPWIGIVAQYVHSKIASVNHVNNGADGKLNQKAGQILIDGHFQLPQHYYLVGQFGGAYLSARPDSVIRTSSNNDFTMIEVGHLRPMFGLGLGYDISKHFSIAATWQRILQHRALPKMDYVFLGLNYYTGFSF